jgi:sec-independent protein translocase protein TatA
MGGLSIWHWIVVGAVVMIFFGRGKVSELMGDVAKGIKEFKKGMAEDDVAKADPAAPAGPVKSIEDQRAASVQAAASERKAS